MAAANRDERYDRPSRPPRLLGSGPAVVAPVDLQAGGTWIGVNGRGVFAVIANAQSAAPVGAGRASRGHVCMEVLRRRSCRSAASYLRELPGGAVGPFFLVAADRTNLLLASYHETVEVRPLRPGLHILTNRGCDAAGDPLAEALMERCAEVFRGTEPPPPGKLLEILSTHDLGGGLAVCRHGREAGTRSATVVHLSARPGRSRYLYADGPPCRTRPRDFSDLLEAAESGRRPRIGGAAERRRRR